VLSPVPHLGNAPLDWDAIAPAYGDRILGALERLLPDLRRSIVVRRELTPAGFQRDLGAYHGSAFSVAPRLGQSAYFRPHNKDAKIRGLYLVGAGTHPGARSRRDQRREGHVRVHDDHGPPAGSNAAPPPRKPRAPRRRLSSPRSHAPRSRTTAELRAREPFADRRTRDQTAVLYTYRRRADDAIDESPQSRRDRLAGSSTCAMSRRGP
jgi:hypothetical protein